MQIIKKRLNAIYNRQEVIEIMHCFESLFNTQNLVSTALTAGAAATFGGSAGMYMLNGQIYTLASFTTQAVPASLALSATGFNAAAFYVGVDKTGTISTYASNISSSTVSAANALATVDLPAIPDGIVILGLYVIQSAATAFTPGTTLLNAAGITTTVINTVGPLYPYTLI